MRTKRRFHWLPWLVLAAAYLFTVGFQALYGMHNLNADNSSEMVLADLLNEEGGFLSTNWYYSTELRVVSPVPVYQLGLLPFDSWHMARTFSVAVLLWMSDGARKVFEPYIVVLNALPKIALGPLIIIWMGTGYTAIIFMTIIVSIIVCIMNTLTGFLQVDGTMLTLMRAMGATKRQILTKLVIPASLPQLMNTLKVAVGLAWIGSIMGEYIVSRAGLGYLIVYGGQVFRLDLVMTATIILCALAAGMYAVVALIEKFVNR